MPRPATHRDAPLTSGKQPAASEAVGAVLGPVVDALRDHVARTGLDRGARQQVGARLSSDLIQQAKKRTGLSSNTDLLTVALVNLVIADGFADAFEAAHGALDPDLDVGF